MKSLSITIPLEISECTAYILVFHCHSFHKEPTHIPLFEAKIFISKYSTNTCVGLAQWGLGESYMPEAYALHPGRATLIKNAKIRPLQLKLHLNSTIKRTDV